MNTSTEVQKFLKLDDERICPFTQVHYLFIHAVLSYKLIFLVRRDTEKI